MLKELFAKLKELIVAANQAGVPVPLIRDPGTGRASVTLTMTFISFNTALLGQIGKITKLIGEVDLSNANYLFLMCLGAYLGRRMSSNSQTKEIKEE